MLTDNEKVLLYIAYHQLEEDIQSYEKHLEYVTDDCLVKYCNERIKSCECAQKLIEGEVKNESSSSD